MIEELSDESNPYGLNPKVFAPALWEHYLECGDLTLLPRRLLLLASVVSLEWASDHNSRSVILFQPSSMSGAERDIVVVTSKKFDGHRAYDFAGKLFVAGRADKTIAQVMLKPGRQPGFEIAHSPRWALANPAPLDDLRRRTALKDLLENSGS